MGSGAKEVDLSLIRHMVVNTIRSYKVKFSAEFGNDVVIACDNRKYWRRDVFPEYKAHRKKARDDSALDWNAFFAALNTIRQELHDFFPYPVIDVNGAEADDVIGALAEYSQTAGEVDDLFGDSQAIPFLVVSGDHDFNQLQKWSNVKQYSPTFKKWIKITEPAEHILMTHIISGDRGDGIPNFLSPDDSFTAGKRQRAIKKTSLDVWKKSSPDVFVLNAEQARGFNRNQQLVDLSKIPQEIKTGIIDSYRSQKNRGREKLLNYLIENKMRHLIDVLTDF